MTALVEATAIAAEASQTLIVAQTFKIANTAQYEEAGAKLQAIKALSKELDETFDPHIKRAFEAHRGLVAEKKTHQSPLQTAEAMLKRTMLGYQQEQEAERRALEAMAQEEARKEREKLEERARKAAEKGKAEKAAALQERAAAVVATMITPTTPKLSGISTRVTYTALVIELMELVKAVAAGTVPLNALLPNQTFLNNQARAMKETLAYPGVKAVAETCLSSRTG